MVDQWKRVVESARRLEVQVFATRIGIWMMPDNHRSGTLEDFLLSLVPQEPIWDWAQEAATIARQKGATWKEPQANRPVFMPGWRGRIRRVAPMESPCETSCSRPITPLPMPLSPGSGVCFRNPEPRPLRLRMEELGRITGLRRRATRQTGLSSPILRSDQSPCRLKPWCRSRD